MRGAGRRARTLGARLEPDLQALADHGALFAAAAGLIPSLKGRLVAAGEAAALLTTAKQATPAEVAAALHEHWRLAHPEAGP
ncbi:TPA: siderophore ferric iron reductase, partial [Aeromonas hydrophila]